MTPTERELRIERDALTAADKWDRRRLTSSHRGFEAGYIVGATAEHDKARNQAIDDCLATIERAHDDGMIYTPYLIKEIESLKTIS